MIDDDPVPDSMRFKVLMRDKQRCLLCGATAKDARLQLTTLNPVASMDRMMSNLQTLCFQCNG
jgi:5-methylcytosine-specific restriction endonuclease McrA